MPIAVSDAISNALSRTADVLFRPFRFKKWLAVSVSAMLILAGEGTGFNGNFNSFRRSPGPGAAPAPAEMLARFREFFNTHFALSILIFIAALLIGYFFYFLSRWLNARGQFMFFHNIVTNTGELAKPWRDYRQLANSFFLFRIIWDHLSLLVSLIIFGLSVFLAWIDLSHFYLTGDYNFTSASTMGILAFVFLMIPYFLLHWFLNCIIFHIAVPVMYIRDMRAVAALKVAWHELFRPHLAACLLYFLCFILIGLLNAIWAFISVFIFALITCCVGVFLIMIPIVGLYPIALLTLPILTFKRAFKLHFISQFGDAYRITWSTPPSTGFPVELNSLDNPPSPFP